MASHISQTKQEKLARDYSFKSLTDIEKLDIAELVALDTLEAVNSACDPVYFTPSFYTKYGKRALDVIISLPASVVFAPINLVLLVGTYIDVGAPILFFQRRIGKDLKMFNLGKFRNMNNERDANGILLPASERVTKWGSFVRKHSLDELLNFYYVLAGKMSIIGPRPMPDEYLPRFNRRHIQRHVIRPGLECPLHSAEYVDGMTWQNRFENDIWYVEHVSLKTDAKMLMLLFEDALFGKRREQRGKAEVGTFIGYDANGNVIVSSHIPKKYYDEIYSRRG